MDTYNTIIEFLRCRLLNSHSNAANAMPIRPKLQEVYDKLFGLLSNTTETPGANHSFLLIGSRGTGKSLVCSFPPAANVYWDCKSPLTACKITRSKTRLHVACHWVCLLEPACMHVYDLLGV